MPEIDLEDIENLSDEEIAAAVRDAQDSTGPRGLRERVKRAEAATVAAEAKAAGVADLARENAMLRAGLNLDDPKTSYFIKGYEGDMTAEAVRGAAVEAGFLDAKLTDPNLSEAQRAALVSVGSETLGTPETAIQEGLAGIAAASNQEEALAAYAKAGGRVKNPLDD